MTLHTYVIWKTKTGKKCIFCIFSLFLVNINAVLKFTLEFHRTNNMSCTYFPSDEVKCVVHYIQNWERNKATIPFREVCIATWILMLRDVWCCIKPSYIKNLHSSDIKVDFIMSSKTIMHYVKSKKKYYIIGMNFVWCSSTNWNQLWITC